MREYVRRAGPRHRIGSFPKKCCTPLPRSLSCQPDKARGPFHQADRVPGQLWRVPSSRDPWIPRSSVLCLYPGARGGSRPVDCAKPQTVSSAGQSDSRSSHSSVSPLRFGRTLASPRAEEPGPERTESSSCYPASGGAAPMVGETKQNR
jgi:hypothetical protein